jgi:hypothetical protein
LLLHSALLVRKDERSWFEEAWGPKGAKEGRNRSIFIDTTKPSNPPHDQHGYPAAQKPPSGQHGHPAATPIKQPGEPAQSTHGTRGGSPEASTDPQWKGKGKESTQSSHQKSIPPFPSNKVGFGRPSGKADPLPPDHMSLLQLLSCRELEKLHPHSTQRGKKVEYKNVTKSKNYPITDVLDNCKPWKNFTFERMLEDFPLLFQDVPRPDELGMWWTWLQKQS